MAPHDSHKRRGWPCDLGPVGCLVLAVLSILSFYLPSAMLMLNTGRPGIPLLMPSQRFVRERGGGAGGRSTGPSVMMVTANQPLPCTTKHGDWIMELALKNKLMYSTLHGYKTWWSTEQAFERSNSAQRRHRTHPLRPR
jgi:hypothetical protein